MSDHSPQVVSSQPGAIGGPEVVRLPNKFDKKPMNMQCNVCRAQIQTSTTESCNPICCIIFGCCALCCCQNVEHKCPNCNAVLGKHTPV